MYRYLFEIGNFRLPAYGFMMVIAYFTAIYFASREARRRDLDPAYIQSLSVWIVIGLVLGARIWYVAEYWHYFSENVIEIFKLWKGGMVFYGGFIGGFIGGVLYLRIARLNFWGVLDILAPGIAIATGIGRIGCFLNGCCFGAVTDSCIGLSFPQRYIPPVYWNHLKRGLITSDAVRTLPVIPTQLISTANMIVIFIILWAIRKKKPFEGFLFSLFLGLYGIHRFVIDFFRYYDGSALVLKVLTLSQTFSIVLILTSIILIASGIKRKRTRGVKALESLIQR